MTHPAFTIRPAALADYAALCELWTELDELHRIAKPDVFRKPDGPVRAMSEVAALIDGPECTLLVAADRVDVPRGMASVIIRRRPEIAVRPARGFAEIDALVVASEHRRQGLARALVEAAGAWARTRGLGSLELSVHEFNAEAQAFYAAMGFGVDLRWMKRPV